MEADQGIQEQFLNQLFFETFNVTLDLCYTVQDCNRGRSYNQTVKLSGCMEDEFTCDDGQCIDINTKCDQIIDCRDKSDEQRCQLIVRDSGYKQTVPPFSVVGL